MTTSEIVKLVIEIICALLICSAVTGCSMDRGWQFNIGVTPISRVDAKVGLEHTNVRTPLANKY